MLIFRPRRRSARRCLAAKALPGLILLLLIQTDQPAGVRAMQESRQGENPGKSGPPATLFGFTPFPYDFTLEKSSAHATLTSASKPAR